MAPARPPLPLIDDVMAEIFLRLPPDEPGHLFRAALVCKPWLRILCDPGFLHCYRAFHGAPPLLGLLYRLFPVGIASTTLIPGFLPPGAAARRTFPVDCRHGLVLMYVIQESESLDYLVWDPVTGDRHAVPWPSPRRRRFWYSAAVLCAIEGCNHLDCHGGPFCIVVMFTFENGDTISSARVYSSETGEWSVPVSLDISKASFILRSQERIAVRHHYVPNLQPKRGTLVGDEIYFTIRLANAIVKYDWRKNCLSMINTPSQDTYYISLMAMDNSTLGFACILGCSLCTWSRKVDTDEAAEWVPHRVIDLEKMIPIVNPDDKPVVVGFAEGVGVVFVTTDAGLFTIELSTGKAKKVDDFGVYFSVLPYMSFYTPDRGTLLSLARAY